MRTLVEISLVALFALPAAAWALGEEGFGNAPRPRQPDWADGVVEVVNLKSRVYFRWVNGNEDFFFRGDTAALNEALRRFAAVKDDLRQVILLPGSGKTQTFEGKPVEYDFQFHVPSGIYRAVTKRTHPVLTVYVNSTKPRPIDRQKVDRWLPDLNSDSFQTRERAVQELQKLGRDAKPHLRAARDAQTTAEGRRRIDVLLQRLNGVDVTDLEIPPGVALVTADDLLATHLKDLNNSDSHVAGMAVLDLSRLASYSDKVVPALIEMTRKGKHEYIRRCAASGLASLGAAAKSAVAALKESLDDPDANVRNACQAAIDRIEGAKEEASYDERVKIERAILKEIAEFKKASHSK
jgi:hypothetical protein